MGSPSVSGTLTVPGTLPAIGGVTSILSIQGDKTAFIEQGQTALMPDGGSYDVGGILFTDLLRDGLPNLPAAYMKIRNINTDLNYPTAIRGSQLEFGTANGLNGQLIQATTAMAIDPNGNVSIGTTTPGARFDLFGDGWFGTGGAGDRVSIGALGASFAFNRNVSTGAIFNPNAFAYQMQHADNPTAAGDYLAFQVYAPSGSVVNNGALAINGSGFVGVNTVTPSTTLEVNGNAQIDGNIAVQSITFPGGGTLTSPFPANLSSSNGNTGIGTASPSSTLEVAANTPSTLGPNLTLTNQANAIGDQEAVTFKSGPYVRAQILSTVVAGASTYSGNIDFQTVGSYQGPLISRLFIADQGNVGIGTGTPGAALEVNGSIKLTSGSGASITFADGTSQSTAFNPANCGADYAESVGVTGDRTKYEPGDVLVLDPKAPGKFLKSNQPYSTMVSGIYSTKPGFVGRLHPPDAALDAAEVPMAMVGRVPTKVSAENGPIKVGDLLVTSSTMGYAMKGTDRSQMLGSIVGKAMGSLDSGTGVIMVLVTLQ